jgi:hypothetical protein
MAKLEKKFNEENYSHKYSERSGDYENQIKRRWEEGRYRAEKDSTVVRVEGRNVLSSQLTP